MNLRAFVIVALGVVTTIVLLTIVPKGAVEEAVGSNVPPAVSTPTSDTTPTTTTPGTPTTAKSGGGKSATTTTVPFVATGRPTLRLGATGDDVTALQQRLNALGYDAGTANGNFNAQTQQAVENFQKAKNLAADGVVGPTTWQALATG
jgi:peptidoglycan hydrolase-like protein with peptidoglycan-binding domain